ncbi:MAG TPA: RNA-processing protein [Candidatus Altiarchaeales archaeon]|nr:RNA-processing protein [Candidatus Altiarchaeales archaeon]
MQYISIPEERLGVLLKSKREIENKTGTKIIVQDTQISIDGDALNEWIARDIVEAIGSGFEPSIALTLLNENQIFELISIKDFSTSKKDFERRKSRIIGTKGKVIRNLERLTQTKIRVHDKTVGIIGSHEDVHLAKEAILSILSGSKHSTAYRMIEKELKRRELFEF